MLRAHKRPGQRGPQAEIEVQSMGSGDEAGGPNAAHFIGPLLLAEKNSLPSD